MSIEINGGGEDDGGDTPTPPGPGDGDGDGDDTPAEPGEAITIDLDSFKGENTSGNMYSLNSPVTVDGYTFTTNKASGSTEPAMNVYQGAGTIRLYANNTLNIKGDKAIAKIVFSINTSTGLKRYTTMTASSGKVGEQASGDESITWTGNTTDLTLTIGAQSIGSEAGKPGQIHISKIEIYPVK